MISRTQMKIDLIGQGILLLLTILLVLLNQGKLGKVNWGIGLLLLCWQIGSAAYYWYQYKYRERRPVFWILLLLLSLILFMGHSLISIGLAALAVVSYLYLTLRDTLRVYRRPRSFWDLG